MCGILCSGITTGVGCVLVLASCLVSFLVVPNIVENMIIDQVVLKEDTIQMEQFEEVPFPLNFIVTIFEIKNPEEVLNGGVPEMTEVGPYVYKLYQFRNITYRDDDILKYRRIEYFEFDADASYPHTEDDLVTIINVPYHAIAQIAEQSFPQLLSILNLALSSVFGAYNSPIITVRVGDLLLDGVPICVNPGILGAVACNIIRSIGEDSQNLVEQEDGSLKFSILDYKNNRSSLEYEVWRGVGEPGQLGEILSLEDVPHFHYWIEEHEYDPGVCNMINGTDSGIYPPFVDRTKPVYAINMDICRSIELRYQYDLEIDGIPTVKFTSNEWFLDNDDGCFCLNVTTGVNRDDGCLLKGAMELFSCVGATLVLSYPHFLYADPIYQNGVVGMMPIEDRHRITLELEPQTGTPVRGAKRAQFNIFQRPVPGIPPTTTLRTVLTPIFWIEESIDLPDQFKDELRDRLLAPLRLLDILIPVLIAICCFVLLLGVVFLVRAKRATNTQPNMVLETEIKT